MKKIIFGIAAICVSGVMSAVEPLLVDGKSWLIEQVTTSISDGKLVKESVEFTLTVNGGSRVNHCECKTIEKKFDNGEMSTFHAYECDGRIYSVETDPVDDRQIYFVPLMDANMVVGGELPMYEWDGGVCFQPKGRAMKVAESLNREVNGRSFTEWLLLSDDGQRFSWVDGVGASKGIWSRYQTSDAGNAIVEERMLECRVNGEVIWRDSDFTSEDYALTPGTKVDAVEPLLVDGKSWLIEEMKIEATPGGSIYGSYEKYYRDYMLTVCGDTVVGGRACKVIEKEYADGEKSRFCAHESDGRVYKLNVYATEDYAFVPLMDFNAVVGSKLPLYLDGGSSLQYYGRYLEVSECIEREVNGRMVKEWILNIDGGNLKFSWVEGIGSSAAKWMVDYPRASALGCDMVEERMKECRMNGEVIWRDSDFTYPFQSGVEDVSAPTAQDSQAIYDLAGRRLQKAPRGLHICGGRLRLGR